jgi:protein-tyrosine phosphatase
MTPIQVSPYKFSNLNDDEFVFYAISQFTPRKNFPAVLKAYLTEFQNNEKVTLVLKTYLINPGVQSEKEKIIQAVKDIKAKLYLKQYPKIVLVSDLLSREQIFQLHQRGDCCLSFHSSEGFGLTPAEAMFMGKPVVATDYSATTDFISEATGFPVKYQMTPVFGMPWENYVGTDEWADINIIDAKKQMRYVYEHQEEAKQKGLVGQQFIKDNFSYEKVGQLIKERINDIKYQKEKNRMNKIFKNVFIGSWQDAKKVQNDKDWLIFTVANNTEIKGHYNYPIVETGFGSFDFDLFKEAVETIMTFVDSDKNLLVHCHSGENRAPAIAMCLLILDKKWTLKRAYKYVQNIRRLIEPSFKMLEFISQITGAKYSFETWENPKLELTETEKQVETLYSTLLGRQVDPDGLIFYSDLIDTNKKTISELEEILKGSEEYKNRQKRILFDSEHSESTDALSFYIL